MITWFLENCPPKYLRSSLKKIGKKSATGFHELQHSDGKNVDLTELGSIDVLLVCVSSEYKIGHVNLVDLVASVAKHIFLFFLPLN